MTKCMGAHWLSGRVLDSRQRGRGFEPHQPHCVVALSKNINPSLVLVQPRKTCPFITERLLMECKESNQTNKMTKGMQNHPACRGQTGFLERGFIYIKVWGFALVILSHFSWGGVEGGSLEPPLYPPLACKEFNTPTPKVFRGGTRQCQNFRLHIFA